MRSMSSVRALQEMFNGHALYEESTPHIARTYDQEDREFLEYFLESSSDIWMNAMPPNFGPNQRWYKVKELTYTADEKGQ